MWGLLQAGPLRRTLNMHVPSFRLEIHAGGGFNPVPSMSGGEQAGFGDFNGDGRPDLAQFNRVGVLARSILEINSRVLWSHNFDPEFSIPWRSHLLPEEGAAYRFYVGRGEDIDGDGHDECFTTACTHSGDRWRFRVIDGRTGRARQVVELPGGEDLRGDGNWDGEYLFLGVIRNGRGPGGGAPLAIVSKVVQYDRFGRGILAVNLETGDTEWFHVMANNPLPSTVQLTDLDGDGLRDVVFLAGAAGNFKEDEEVDGLKDDHARVVALGHDGSLRWMVEVTDCWGTSGSLMLQDLDGDGRQEIICGTTTALEEKDDHIFVFRRDGTLVAKRKGPRVDELIALPCPGDPRQFYVASYDHTITGFALADTGLVEYSQKEIGPVTRFFSPVTIGDRSDFLLIFSNEDAFVFHPREGWQRVACNAVPPMREMLWMPCPEGENAIFILTDRWEMYDLVPAANHLAARAALMALPLLVALAPPAWYRRRRRARVGVTGAEREAVKIEIARRLKRDHHDRTGLLFKLEKLRRNLEWAESQTDGEQEYRQVVLRTLLEGCDRLVAEDIPAILESADLSNSLGLSSGFIERLHQRAEQITSYLAVGREKDDPLAHLERGIPRLRAAVRDMLADLRHLSEEFARYECVDLWEEVQKVLEDHRETIAGAGVQVNLGDPPTKDARVLLPRRDLTHILDNLVRNACLVMRDSAPRLLQIQAVTLSGRVQCEFTDTGPGIPPELQDRIFREPVTSSHEGTGEGLYRDARLLEKYDGRLEAVDTEGEDGACIRLTLPFL